MSGHISAAKLAIPMIPLLSVGLLCAQATKDTASLSGTVLYEKGAPVQATVTAIAGTFTQRQLTGAKGVFAFSHLPAGTYVLCGKLAPAIVIDLKAGANDPPLDSCAWLDSTSPRVPLSAAQARTGVSIVLKRGRLLTIRVNDPAKLLPAKVGQQSGNELALRIAGPSALVYRIPITGQDALGRTHSIVIPYDTPHKLWMQSTTFALKDSGNRDISAAAAIPVQVAHGDPETKLVVNLSSKVSK